ncbi:hypothetical protein VCRA2112E186_160052 [Vibrio crassostreae]|nr:hypothetical protein VCRA2113O207_110076 [Vibrio crassostreae]CAK1734714.1 hypothetical protein VCRA2113O213_120082 [Vibrio crassostreae]CAK1756391.1 hypothetical protein VCRA2119O245_140052 [Vibrio crassostreae]CAK1783829.1 hypothetical protein VCRA2112E186_160052 [Vibrio crassostreae]CAK1784760.1 hypothetical protein VCRA2113O196_150081 [Vibrio crassostreae]
MVQCIVQFPLLINLTKTFWGRNVLGIIDLTDNRSNSHSWDKISWRQIGDRISLNTKSYVFIYS